MKYRMNRATYAFLLGALAVAYVVMVNTMKRPPGAEVFVAVIAVPRLHDVGRSGWWLLLLLAGEFIAIAIGWSAGVDGIMLAGGIYVLLAFLLLVALAFVPGDPGPNRWGDPPMPGVRLGRPKRSAESE